jgi:hypothetical protein
MDFLFFYLNAKPLITGKNKLTLSGTVQLRVTVPQKNGPGQEPY